jgi:hypothetical protein
MAGVTALAGAKHAIATGGFSANAEAGAAQAVNAALGQDNRD